jgi:hypothetical protein
VQLRGFSNIDEAVRYISKLPSSLGELEFEAFEFKLQGTEPELLLELEQLNTTFSGLIASVLVLLLSRTQVVGSFPPKFCDTGLARCIAERMGGSASLREALPKYYQDALKKLLASSS